MDKALSVEQLLDGASSIRNLRRGYLSNFFFDYYKHSLWISKGDCFTQRIGDTFFIIKDNPGFLSVFFCTTDTNSLKIAIEILGQENEDKTLVVDIVGKGDAASMVRTCLKENGYRNVCSLVRMSRQTKELPYIPVFENICYATPDHAPLISDFLDQYFDKELEQLPYIEEIYELIKNNRILVYLDGRNIAGFLIYEKNKTTQHLRYWFVCPQYRDKKIGSLLLKRFFYEGNDTKRQILWVVKSNENSLKRYLHYGFQEEGLKDEIFIKGQFKPNPLTTNNLTEGGGKLKIAFFGEDAFSCVILSSLLDAGYEVPLAVTPLYDNLIYKRLELICAKNSIRFLREKNVNSESVTQAVREVAPDLGVISHFEKLIKKELIDIPEFGFINLHPSLLPDYRGMSPQHWPIINGEENAGITVHYVDENADTGDIIAQRTYKLPNDCYVSDLQKIWLSHYRTFMLEAISNVLHGRKTVQQKNIKLRYYGKLRDEQCRIPKDATVREAYNRVRGVSMPYRGAYWEDTTIFRAHIIEEGMRYQEDEIGIVIYSKDSAVLRLKDGTLAIDKYVKQEMRLI